MDRNNLFTDIVKSFCDEYGFDLYGISKITPLEEDAKQVEKWLENSFHAEMHYMENNKEKRYDPSKLVEGAQSVVTVLFNYYPKKILPQQGNYKMAKYAYGKDYHFVIKDRLNELLARIQQHIPEAEGRAFTDSAPFLDRAWARRNGLGFIGKNTCLINKKKGSFFLIGQLVVNIAAHVPAEEVSNACGKCTRCIDACPTGALTEPFQLDASKCISYLTIEHKGDLPKELQPKFNDWVFGCDICQDVCPWNRFSKPNEIEEFQPNPLLFSLDSKSRWEAMKPEEFGEIFRSTAVKRTKFKGITRNISFLRKEE